MVINKREKAKDSLAGLRFMVADDHKFSRQIVIDVLRSLDVTGVIQAKDGGEAISIIQGMTESDAVGGVSMTRKLDLTDKRVNFPSVFDCIITDFNMHPLNGLHILKAVRTGTAGCARDTSVIILTGFSDDYLISAALQLDVDAFILKPISRIELQTKISRILMSPIEPKAPGDYQKIAVPDSVGPTGEPVKKTPLTAVAGKALQLVAIDMIKTGSILVEDLIGPNGSVFIHGGTQLSDTRLKQLIDLEKAGFIPGTVHIRES